MRVAASVGHPLSPGQVEKLARFHDWVVEEALPAGGIGPAECPRLHDRHLADSLLFARFFAPPSRLWDLGSGVGLPGIPLAVMLPETQFELFDRSGRRCQLMKRAKRVLGLENVVVRQEDIAQIRGTASVIVSRASLPPDRFRPHLERFLEPGGIAVVGGSWVAEPVHSGWTTEEGSRGSLDRAVWFLIMRRQ